ncbi:MAG: DNA translocase FtsK 4TM domain-containing protein [Candidatus Gribaldobacteria bacterium]|nr:DNA translocase FtsK 4TM domain-containing protein [Candidatus Gribaldobacteria bacterium]
MGKNNNKKNNQQKFSKSESVESEEKIKYPVLTTKLRRGVVIIVLVLIGLILVLSFFNWAGSGGELLLKVLKLVVGKGAYFLPVLMLTAGILIFKPQKKRVTAPTLLAVVLLLFGIIGLFSVLMTADKGGGWLGYLLAWPFFKYFGNIVAIIVFSALVVIGGLIVWEFLPKNKIFGKKDQLESKKPEIKKEEIKEKPKFEIKPLVLPAKAKEIQGKQEQSNNFQAALDLSKNFGGNYKRPPLELFDTIEEKPSSGDINYSSQMIKKTLQTFGIEVEMGEVNTGPTVTQYTFKPADGVKLAKITALNNDLALALAAHPIRIEAPIPGRSLVGIEMPNKVRVPVKLGTLFSMPDYQKSPYPLCLAVGRDVMGKSIFVDLGAMPHLLVAGATGSGKSICLNSIIVSLVCRNSPKLLRLILIDPKRVEFPIYSKLPHLLTPVIVNSQKATNALNWLVGEMDRRFEVLQEAGARDIMSYNKAIIENKGKKGEEQEVMPYIVLVIDELADLMMAKGHEVEATIVRLSQLARAVGIHLIVATQRPSVEVITGLIKANITSRIAFQVASQIDSRTILDTAGSEKLLGRGDMLYISSEFSRPKRIQGGYITSTEIKKVVNFIEKENNFDSDFGGEEIADGTSDNEDIPGVGSLEFTDAAGEDSLYAEAKKIVIEYQKASASLLQRRLKIGYARAARLLDILEENNIVGPGDGAKPRDVLIAGGARPVIRIKEPEDEFVDPSKIEFE